MKPEKIDVRPYNYLRSEDSLKLAIVRNQLKLMTIMALSEFAIIIMLIYLLLF